MSKLKTSGTIYSWTLQALISMLCCSSSKYARIAVKRPSPFPIEALPNDILHHIAQYLFASTVLFALHKPFASLHTPLIAKLSLLTPQLHCLHQQELILGKFIYLIAVDGENNQDKAETLLKHYPSFKKLTTQKYKIKDAAGRHFITPMSAFGYAFLSGDIRMCWMMKQYMDGEARTEAGKECLYIMEQQCIPYFLKGVLHNHSTCYDFTPLINAYKALISATNINDAWSNLSNELMSVPLHLAQEYCASTPFFPLEDYQNTFNKHHIKRTIKIQNALGEEIKSWYSLQRYPEKFCVYKTNNEIPVACIANNHKGWPHVDLHAIMTLNEHIQRQRIHLLKSLNPDLITKTRHTF